MIFHEFKTLYSLVSTPAYLWENVRASHKIPCWRSSPSQGQRDLHIVTVLGPSDDPTKWKFQNFVNIIVLMELTVSRILNILDRWTSWIAMAPEDVIRIQSYQTCVGKKYLARLIMWTVPLVCIQHFVKCAFSWSVLSIFQELNLKSSTSAFNRLRTSAIFEYTIYSIQTLSKEEKRDHLWIILFLKEKRTSVGGCKSDNRNLAARNWKCTLANYELCLINAVLHIKKKDKTTRRIRESFDRAHSRW